SAYRWSRDSEGEGMRFTPGAVVFAVAGLTACAAEDADVAPATERLAATTRCEGERAVIDVTGPAGAGHVKVSGRHVVSIDTPHRWVLAVATIVGQPMAAGWHSVSAGRQYVAVETPDCGAAEVTASRSAP